MLITTSATNWNSSQILVFKMAACNVYKNIDLKKKDGSNVKVRFQKAPTCRMEEVIDFYSEQTLQNDVFAKAAGIYNYFMFNTLYVSILILNLLIFNYFFKILIN